MEHAKAILLGAAIMAIIALITTTKYGTIALFIAACLALAYGLGTIALLLWNDFKPSKKKDTRVELHEHV